MRNNKGFSLVELMIVVAIIGILAAIAIPNFIAMQLKAKRGEVPGNVDGIKTAELSYDASFDKYVSAAENPGAPSGKAPTAWVSTAEFAQINWKPDGEVRGAYTVDAVTNTDFTVHGACDVDGDANLSTYTATTSTNAAMTSASDVY